LLFNWTRLQLNRKDVLVGREFVFLHAALPQIGDPIAEWRL
jgi:hypothetical protein